MMNRILRFLRSEDGPTAVEYAVMIGLIIVVALVGIGLVGTQTADSYNSSSDQIDQAISGGGN